MRVILHNICELVQKLSLDSLYKIQKPALERLKTLKPRSKVKL